MALLQKYAVFVEIWRRDAVMGKGPGDADM